MSVTHTTYEVYDHPEPVPVPNYPAIAIEELSLKYKALIEAERKHFMTAEQEYNEFIFKMDAIHKELESKLNRHVIENNELRIDNTELARKLRELEINFEKKSETLKKLYTVHLHLTKKLEAMEQDNVGLRGTADKTTERNFEISSDLKNVLQERNYLDDRIADMQARHTVELNRLHNTITDRERQILDREREIDRLNADLRRISDDNHRLKMDLDSLRMNYDSTLNQKDMEIQHLRRLLEDQRNQPTMLTPTPGPIIDNNSNEETIWKLKTNLEEAYRTIENLTRNPKKQVEIIEKPKFIDRIVEKPVERIIRVPVENERERESYRMGRPGMNEEESDAGWDDDRREKLLMFAQRMFNKKLAHLYFVIWKLLFHIDHMDRLLKKYRAGGNEPNRNAAMQDLIPRGDDLPAFQEGLLGIYHDIRRGIVDYIFEIFVRSANHAHQKKVNSLILFIINVKELKEHHVSVFLLLLDSFMRIRLTVKSHIKTKAWAVEAGKSASKNIDKRKTSDLEFRDMTNSWIQDTLENIKRRRNFDRHDPQNMEYLYLFRLLAIKYRVIYPLRGKPFEVDADLAVKLETKICKAFLRVVEIEDVANS